MRSATLVLVLDASAAIEMALGTSLGTRVLDAVSEGHTWHAPDLLGIETVSALRRMIRAGHLTATEAERALDTLQVLGVECYESGPLLERMLQLRDSVSAYDAAYVALAEVLDAQLVTCDGPLAAAHGHRASVVLIAP